MKKKYFIALLLIIFSVIIFSIFNFHDIYSGQDELRFTKASEKIMQERKIVYKNKLNEKFNTYIFFPKGFLISEERYIYPRGFVLNSLVQIPLLLVFTNSTFVFNIFSLITYLIVFLLIYLVIKNRTQKVFFSFLGATVFSLTNFYLALFTSFYPDSFFLLLFILWMFIKESTNDLIIIELIVISFMIAYKITAVFIFFPYLLFIFFKKLKKRELKEILSSLAIFLVSLTLFNTPQFCINQRFLGNLLHYSYEYYSQPKTFIRRSNHNELINNSKNNYHKSEQSIIHKFYFSYLRPKKKGKTLWTHIENDSRFFISNNFFLIIGFIILLNQFFRKKNQDKFNKKIYLIMIVLNFLIWGNMSKYGGKNSFHLRNSHIRYMMPLLLLLFIEGYSFSIKKMREDLIYLLSIYVVLEGVYSLKVRYPFSTYSLINKNSYLYELREEKKQLMNLGGCKDKYFLSLAEDDYDLSYTFTKYGQLQILSYPTEIINFLNKIVYGDPVCLLVPKIISEYNDLSETQIKEIESYVLRAYNSKVLFESKYKKLYELSYE